MLGFHYTMLPLIIMKRAGIDKLQACVEPGPQPQISGLTGLLPYLISAVHPVSPILGQVILSWWQDGCQQFKARECLYRELLTQYSPYWLKLGLVTITERKNLSGWGPGPWVGLGLRVTSYYWSWDGEIPSGSYGLMVEGEGKSEYRVYCTGKIKDVTEAYLKDLLCFMFI